MGATVAVKPGAASCQAGEPVHQHNVRRFHAEPFSQTHRIRRRSSARALGEATAQENKEGTFTDVIL